MDATEAIDELLRVSDEIRAAVIFDRGGELVASSLPDDQAREIAALGDAMLAYAATLRPIATVRQLEVGTPNGDVYVARQGERGVVAIAAPGSLAALVQHDLRMLLGSASRRKRPAVTHA
jgi:predicted regulator of Ras-like GTPase activity (Roadblock/LC7/MglB family)